MSACVELLGGLGKYSLSFDWLNKCSLYSFCWSCLLSQQDWHCGGVTSRGI